MRETLAKGLRRTGHLDLAGGGQVYVANGYAYIGHMDAPDGTTIVDVRDPAAPKIVTAIRLDTERSHSHKVRVAGDLMITNVEMAQRHAVRRAAAVPQAEVALAARLGRPPTDAEIGAALSLKPHQFALLRDFAARPYSEGGFKVWDVSNKARPRELAYVKTHGFGVHRFDMDDRYAYISTEMAGFVGNILVIYDLQEPSRPAEVSRWWLPGQHIAGGETPAWTGTQNRLHHAMRCGSALWAAVWHGGFRVIDVTDITKPRTIGSFEHQAPFPEPTHTILKVPFPVAGRDIAVGADEEHDHIPGQLHAGLWVFDVAKRDAIRPIGMFHLSELDSPYARKGQRFGMHQFQEHLEDTRLYCAWFGGGLRVIDIKQPTLPTETGYFIPEPVGGQPAPQTNDVDTDARGLVYIIDRFRGFDILEPA